MRLITLLFQAVAICVCCVGLARAEEPEGVFSIPVGSLELLALHDADGSMAASLLPDLPKEPEMASYFAHGPIPSVFQTYFLRDGSHRVLFDAGWGDGVTVKGQTASLLEHLGINPADITDICMTHLDHDHIGGLIRSGKAVYPNATLWISRPEFEAWQNGAVQGRSESSVTLARQALSVYDRHIRLFDFGQEILPGIVALDAAGHSPGHTAYEISSGDARLIIAGDILHIPPVQLRRPDMSTVYDMDADKAAAARKRLLQRAAETHAQLAGMHFSTVSPVMQTENGAYLMREARAR